MLKRNISDSRRLAELKTDSARLLWTWIIPYLDVEGQFYSSPDLIKGKIVPRLKTFTETKIEEYLQDMAAVGLITLYEVDGERYLKFRKFDDFQNIRKDREGSPLPAPEDGEMITPGALREHSGDAPGALRPNIREVKLSKEKVREEKIKHLDAVFLTEDEHKKLIEANGELLVNKAIEILNNYIMANGKKYKSHYHTLLQWPLTEAKKQGGGSKWFNSNS